MKTRIVATLFLLCISINANAQLLFTITGNTTSAFENKHYFDINSVVFTSTEGYSLDEIANSSFSLLSTGAFAAFNGYTSYLSQTNIGTDYVVETTESHFLSFEKEASILDLDTDALILSGTLTVESLLIYDGVTSYSGTGTFTMKFYDNSGGGSGGGTPAVPVPAAVWLFASGILGLIGVARRKA